MLGFIYGLLLRQIGQLLLVVLYERLDCSVGLADFALELVNGLELL